MRSALKWAHEQFGHVEAVDVRHRRRLVVLAAEAAARPAGTITRACATPASREGAFRLLENPAVRADAVVSAVQRATAERCPKAGTIFVPLDGTSLAITDRTNKKGLGKIGTWSVPANGLLVMSALALSKTGQPIGLLSQHTWIRSQRSLRPRNHPTLGGENTQWVDALEDCRSALSASAPQLRAWYQIDRGGDCWQVLSYAAEKGVLVTVRATHDRRLDGEVDRLWAAVETAPLLAKLSIDVPARGPIRRMKRNRLTMDVSRAQS